MFVQLLMGWWHRQKVSTEKRPMLLAALCKQAMYGIGIGSQNPTCRVAKFDDIVQPDNAMCTQFAAGSAKFDDMVQPDNAMWTQSVCRIC